MSLACVCCWFGQAPAAGPDLPAVLQLKYARPTRVLAVLKNSQVKLPSGIQSVKPDDRAMSMTVLGSPKSIGELKELLQLLDIVPHRVQLQVDLLRIAVGADGGQKTEVIASIRRRAVNNDPIQLDTKDPDSEYHLTITPRINGDGTATMVGSCGIKNDDVDESIKFANRLDPGRRYRVGGTSNVAELRDRLRTGPSDELAWDRTAVVYLLEIQFTPAPR